MDDHAEERWSIPLGSWQGISLRLHLSLVLLTIGLLAATASTHLVAGVILVAVVFTSALLHEAAHQAACNWLQGERPSLILTPLGGLRLPSAPHDPEAQLLIAMVGSMVNLSIVVVTTSLLAFTGANLTGLFAVFAVDGMLAGPPAMVALKTALWFNWLSFLLCLIPVFPFDGAPALRAALWSVLGRRSAAIVTAHLGRVVGVLLAVAGAVMLQASPDQALTITAPLAALAAIVLCSAQHDLTYGVRELDHGIAGYLEESPQRIKARHSSGDPGGIVFDEEDSWSVNPFEDSETQEVNEDEAVDAILKKLHLHGPQDLSAEERRVLERASRRYRNRRRQS